MTNRGCMASSICMSALAARMRMNSGRFSQNSLSLATSCAFLPNCLVNVFQSGNSSPAVLIRRRMSATVGSRPVSSASRANFSNNAASPWALVILLGSYPASLIASLHRAQCLPFHSDSAMPVSVANFRHPNGVPPLMAVVLLISAMISAFVISARYLIQRSARVQNHNSWASWLASDDTRIFLTFRQEDSGIARKAHCAPHGADERVRERIQRILKQSENSKIASRGPANRAALFLNAKRGCSTGMVSSHHRFGK